VILSGVSPEPGASEQALEAVRSARCPTWTGQRLCATAVQAKIREPLRWPDLRASLRGGELTLEGTVPSEEARRALATRAQGLRSPPRIVQVRDALVVSGRPAPEAWEGLARRAVDVAGGCLRGSASLRGGLFSVTGVAPGASLARLRAQATAPAEGAQIGAVDLFAAEAISACEGTLRALLEASPIEFEADGAALARTAAALLDRLAEVAAQCPGTLRIEGHTEAIGAPERNLELSRVRAGAVRAALIARGLDAAHLVAEGYAGSPHPTASPLDPTARARDHRIEIHVAAAP
jgi:outer membrane protein OmpA-like peptidoglycan-associated protein